MTSVQISIDANVAYTATTISQALNGRVSRSGMTDGRVDTLPSAADLKLGAFGPFSFSMVGRYFDITFSNDNADDHAVTLEFPVGLTLKPASSFTNGTQDTIKRYHSRTYRFVGTSETEFDVYLLASTIGGSAVNELKGEGTVASDGTFTLGPTIGNRALTFQGSTEFTKSVGNNAVDHTTAQGDIALYLPDGAVRAHSFHSRYSIAVGAQSETKISAGKISGLDLPLAGTDAATKAYVDSKVNGLSWKAPATVLCSDPVLIATSPPSGTAPLAVDGRTLVGGERVLLVSQAVKKDNGLWIVAAQGNWTRPADFAQDEVFTNVAVFVSEGTVHKDTAWVCSSEGKTGTDDQDWTKFSAGVAVTSLNNQSGPLTLAATNSGTELKVETNNSELKINIPSAGPMVLAGLVASAAQSFGGLKTFQDGLALGNQTNGGVQLSGSSVTVPYSLLFPNLQGAVGQYLALADAASGTLAWTGFTPAFGTVKGPSADLVLTNQLQDVVFNATVVARTLNYFGDFASTPRTEIDLPALGHWKVQYSMTYASDGNTEGSLTGTVAAGPLLKSGAQGSTFDPIPSVDPAYCQVDRAPANERVATLSGTFIVESTTALAQLKFVTTLFSGSTPVKLTQGRATVTLEKIS
jgi:hypothetical protein